MNDDDIALDELFAAARELQPPAGAEARGWARFEAALGGPPPGGAAGAPLGWLAPAAKLGGVAAAVLALGVALVRPDDPPREERAAAAAPSTSAPMAEPASPRPTATPDPPPARDPSPPSTRARTGARPHPPAASRASAPRPAVKAEPIAPVEPARAPAPEVVVVQRPTASTSPTAPTAATTDSLRVEAELLGRAWVAIREGRAEQLHALLDEHARRFPDGALVPERTACRIVARCLAGEHDAIDRARRYLDQHRASHLAARVAVGCGLRTPNRPSDPEAAAMDGLERPGAAEIE